MWPRDALVETYMPAPSESCSCPSLGWGPFTWGQGAWCHSCPLYSMGKAGGEKGHVSCLKE